MFSYKQPPNSVRFFFSSPSIFVSDIFLCRLPSQNVVTVWRRRAMPYWRASYEVNDPFVIWLSCAQTYSSIIFWGQFTLYTCFSIIVGVFRVRWENINVRVGLWISWHGAMYLLVVQAAAACWLSCPFYMAFLWLGYSRSKPRRSKKGSQKKSPRFRSPQCHFFHLRLPWRVYSIEPRLVPISWDKPAAVLLTPVEKVVSWDATTELSPESQLLEFFLL